MLALTLWRLEKENIFAMDIPFKRKKNQYRKVGSNSLKTLLKCQGQYSAPAPLLNSFSFWNHWRFLTSLASSFPEVPCIPSGKSNRRSWNASASFSKKQRILFYVKKHDPRLDVSRCLRWGLFFLFWLHTLALTWNYLSI